MPIFEFQCSKCNHRWNQFFHNRKGLPRYFETNVCPKCSTEEFYLTPSITGYRRDHTVL